MLVKLAPKHDWGHLPKVQYFRNGRTPTDSAHMGEIGQTPSKLDLVSLLHYPNSFVNVCIT